MEGEPRSWAAPGTDRQMCPHITKQQDCPSESPPPCLYSAHVARVSLSPVGSCVGLAEQHPGFGGQGEGVS